MEPSLGWQFFRNRFSHPIELLRSKITSSGFLSSHECWLRSNNTIPSSRPTSSQHMFHVPPQCHICTALLLLHPGYVSMCICPKISVLSLGFSYGGAVEQSRIPETFLVPRCVLWVIIYGRWDIRPLVSPTRRRPGNGRNLLEQNSYGEEEEEEQQQQQQQRWWWYA